MFFVTKTNILLFVNMNLRKRGDRAVLFKKPYKTLMTRHLNDDIADSEEMAKAVYEAMQRFSNGDWGELCQDDKEANNQDLENRDGHVLARYKTPNGDIYINLEFDEASMDSDVAMIMYCSEY